MLAGIDELRERGAQWVVVSSGGGPLVAAGPGRAWRVLPPAASVVNPIGSGDCLAAGLACGLVSGSDMADALRLGLAAAAQNVGQLLPAALDREGDAHVGQDNCHRRPIIFQEAAKPVRPVQRKVWATQHGDVMKKDEPASGTAGDERVADDATGGGKHAAERRPQQVDPVCGDSECAHMLNSIAAGVVRISREGRITYINAQGRRLLGVMGRDPMGMSLHEFEPYTIWADESPCTFDQYPPIKCVRTGEFQTSVIIGLRVASGRLLWVTVTAEPLLDPQTGKPESALVTVVDSSHPKHIEDSLRYSEERYRNLLEHAPDAIVVHQGGPIRYINDAGVKLWGGRTREDFIGRNILDFVHSKFRAAAQRRVGNVMSGEPTPLMEQRHVRFDGRSVFVEVTGLPCYYDGQRCVQAIFRDVTERKRVDRLVRRQREILRKFFDRLPVLVGVFDAAGRTKVVNREWKRVMGWGTELSLDEYLAHVYSDPVERQRAYDFLLARQPGWSDFPVTVKDGRTRYLSWANIWLSSGDHIGIAQDVTDRRLAAEALLRAKQELETRVEERTEELTRKNEELSRKQRFMERTLAAQERDRTLVAYEIHDTFLQDVIGALMFVDTMYENCGADGNPQNAPLEQARRLLRNCIAEARRMISGLRPPIIDEQGVRGGVEYLVNEFNGRGMDTRVLAPHAGRATGPDSRNDDLSHRPGSALEHRTA